MSPRRNFLFPLLSLLAVSACALSDESQELNTASKSQALFSNGGFETGDFTGWTKTTALNSTGLSAVPPTSTTQLRLSTGGADFTFVRNNATPESQLPAGLSAMAGVPRWPKFGANTTVINEWASTNPPGKNFHQGANNNVNSIKQTLVTSYSDVDPADDKLHIRFVLAPVLEAAGHDPDLQPFFFVVVRNTTAPRAGEIYTNFNFANQTGVPWSSQGSGASALLYTDWQLFDLVPDDDKFLIGDTLEIEVYAAGCQPGGHSGSAYVDGFGEKFPGLYITKTAPTSTNVDEDITYTFHVQNNTSGVAPNVVADEVLPPNTTFVSYSAPGATCTVPAVGAAGTVSCTYGWMNPGASADFTVTVHNNTPAFSGTASGGGNNRLNSSQTLTANQWVGYTLYISGGQGLGQQRVITTNTAAQINITPNWTTNPNNTSSYKIINPPLVLSTATAGANTTLTDATQNWTSNQWLGRDVVLLSGTGAPQTRRVTSNTNNQLTVSPNFGTDPTVGTTYAIVAPLTSIVNGNYGVKGNTISRLLGPKRETALTTGIAYTDLSITNTDGVPSVSWGGSTTYTVTVTNNGPSAVTGATVKETFPPELATHSWNCVGSNGGTCGTASGTGNINVSVNLPVGATATFTINATIISGSGAGSVNTVATVTAPANVTEQFPLSNSDSDQNSISGALFTLTAGKTAGSTGTGTITSVPSGIDCGTSCTSTSNNFASGTTVTLYAVAVPNNLFAGWSGDCTGTGPCTVTMSQARNVTALFTTCGNAVLNAGEGCDDGNLTNGDGCNSVCLVETGSPCGTSGNGSCASGICDPTSGGAGSCEAANACGNSVREGTEGCDDGNTSNGDGCSSTCKVETGSPCGPGGSGSCASNICDITSGAPGTCEAANVCGNSVREGTEGCDDGNTTNGDGCSSSCKVETGRPCGPGGSTSCQSGICDVTGGAPGTCEAANSCGNSVREGTEGCDDGNNVDGDGCNSACKIETGLPCGTGGNSSCASNICDVTSGAPGTCEAPNTCGNSVREGTEGCDDGNNVNGDGCNSTCKVETGKPCGPGGSTSCASNICDVTSGAPGTCEAANTCGNSVREGTEGCDDGNTVSGDGCNATCKIENGGPCGPGGSTSCASNICDVTSGAPGTCEPANACGNSVLEAGEGCDDGNNVNGDGCNATCRIETGNACSSNPAGNTGSASCASTICDVSSGAPGVCEAANTCGNSVREGTEGCDDGNNVNNDGCSASCKVENGNPCGPGGSASCASNICDVTSGAPGTCEPANTCGNSVREGTEGCDDGNTTNGDGCNASCKVETGKPCGPGGSSSCQSGICDVTSGAPGVCEAANSCGNSVREGTEGCDDGNNVNGDGCNATCLVETGLPCGPGGSTSCQSGICDVTSGAPGVCEAANACGNSVREGTEGCDDGNNVNGDGCNATCLVETGLPCGPGGSTSCQSGICDVTSGAPGVCEAANSCGNSVREGTEGCDDGNTVSGDGCNATCLVETGNPCGPGGSSSCQSGICDLTSGAPGSCEAANACGNSVREGTEGCDDGNTSSGDGCSATCLIESGNPCGPGGDASCQSGICNTSGGAPGVCQTPNSCGNSVREGTEGCDDGNQVSGDGCDASCRIENGAPCGPGASSSCQSGVCDVTSGAPGVCEPANSCGNSLREGTEGCDDGNVANGDGCSSTCKVETGNPCGPGGSNSCQSGICDVTSGAPGVCEAANSCGNSVREGTEGCDDGNTVSGDGCNATCRIEDGGPCGPGGSSSCQSGVCDVTSGAPGFCEPANFCGNSVLEAGEGCDDGNNVSGDGCNATCRIEINHPCSSNPAGDTGSASCQSNVCDFSTGAPGVCEAANVCGNSVREGTEGCDDGNATSGDGCSASCLIENGNPCGADGGTTCASGICDVTGGAPGVCEPTDVCGNSVREGTEGCDDGNASSGDGCSASCLIEDGNPCGAGGSTSCASGICDGSSGGSGVCEPANTCGNSVREAGEGCDDGNVANGDGCTASCLVENGNPCGPGGGTTCQSGICDVTSGGAGTCEPANSCGNSVREGTEGCDDGNVANGDGCNASCKIETGNPCGTAGDTTCASGVCDVTSGAPGVCEPQNACGNSVREGTEGCDDGNTTDGDGCNATCLVETGNPCGPGGDVSCQSGVCDVTSGGAGVCEPQNACGNSVREGTEGCDDGNTADGDGCNASCLIETSNPCGPGGDASCQSGVCDVTSGAPGVCEPQNACGNSVVEAGEGCDDGNTGNGDGCDSACLVETGNPCGAGGSSSCQSGVCDQTSGGAGLCEPADTCGNSVREAGEGCDDGNTTNGDGCNATCLVETNHPCGPTGGTSCQSGVCDVTSGAPGVCEPVNACGNSVREGTEGCDDGNVTNGDGCNAACLIETGNPCGTGGNSSCQSGVCDQTSGGAGVCEPAGACGNSVREGTEGCDDGNVANGDGCNSTCLVETGNPCGPGGGVSCESGVCDSTGGTPGVCEPANVCGNSVREGAEGCDDGNSVNGDGCNSTCLIENGNPCGALGDPTCASGVCDSSTGEPLCEAAGSCGNSKLEAGEGCDDGNTQAGDGCNATCKIETGNACNANPAGSTGNTSCASNTCDTSGGAPGTCEAVNVCGNAVLEAGEGCDDGNATDGDGCNGSCRIETGNACNADTAGATGNNSCASNVCDVSAGAPGTCEAANSCGNAVLEPGEGCDDGNTVAGDGCGVSCLIETGNACNDDAEGKTGSESCESGVCNTTGGAPGMCEAAGACGNSVVETGEGCDDGNTTAGDGCDASCKIESGHPCSETGNDSCASGSCNGNGVEGTCESLVSCDACGPAGGPDCPTECQPPLSVTGGGCGCNGTGSDAAPGAALLFGLVLIGLSRARRNVVG